MGVTKRGKFTASDLRHPRYMGVGLQTVHQESRDDEGKEGSPPWTPAGKGTHPAEYPPCAELHMQAIQAGSTRGTGPHFMNKHPVLFMKCKYFSKPIQE